MEEQDDDYRSSDDEDYVPEKDTTVEDVEDESEGDEADEVSAADGDIITGKRRVGKGKKSKKEQPKEQKSSVDVDAFFAAMLEQDSKKLPTQTSSRNKPSASSSEIKFSSSKEESPSTSEQDNPTTSVEEKKTVTQVFDFAGEEVSIQKEVSADEFNRIEEEKRKAAEKPEKKPTQKRVGGLGDMLTLLKKKPKMSILDKSNHDWSNFKKENDLQEELQTHNRGKGGYLSNQEFLIRTDLRQFENEKSLRAGARKK